MRIKSHFGGLFLTISPICEYRIIKCCRTPWSCCVYWELYLCCCTITTAAEAGGCWLNATRILLLLLPVASSRPPRQQQQQQQQQHTPRLLWPSPALCCYQIFIVCRVDRADKQRGSTLDLYFRPPDSWVKWSGIISKYKTWKNSSSSWSKDVALGIKVSL